MGVTDTHLHSSVVQYTFGSPITSQTLLYASPHQYKIVRQTLQGWPRRRWCLACWQPLERLQVAVGAPEPGRGRHTVEQGWWAQCTKREHQLSFNSSGFAAVRTGGFGSFGNISGSEKQCILLPLACYRLLTPWQRQVCKSWLAPGQVPPRSLTGQVSALQHHCQCQHPDPRLHWRCAP